MKFTEMQWSLYLVKCNSFLSLTVLSMSFHSRIFLFSFHLYCFNNHCLKTHWITQIFCKLLLVLVPATNFLNLRQREGKKLSSLPSPCFVLMTQKLRFFFSLFLGRLEGLEKHQSSLRQQLPWCLLAMTLPYCEENSFRTTEHCLIVWKTKSNVSKHLLS